MKRLSLLVLSLLFALSASANTTFNFLFDRNPKPGIQSHIVGTGSFTFSNDPGNGTFAFNSLGSFSIAFSFINGASFTGADITSDLSQVEVIISPFGTERRLQFFDTGAGGGGTFGGSLDFLNARGRGLSFEPSYFGGNLNLYFFARRNGSIKYFANYLGTAPVPDAGSTWALMLLAVMGVVGLQHLFRSSSLAAPRS